MATATAANLSATLSALQVRWGDAAPRVTPEVIGTLAIAPFPADQQPDPLDRAPTPLTGLEPAYRSGFAALDAILAPAGIPRSGSVALAGDGSVGVTTLALRLAAAAQDGGAIVAWVDIGRSFDPVEAVARGVRPEWLAVIVPASLDEGLAMASDLLVSRTVDLIVLDLPGDRTADGRRALGARIERLTAIARRADALLVVLEPPGRGRAIGETAHLRLELTRSGWIRLGRDVVGLEAEAVIARNRRGPPGRRAGLRILYAEGGDRDACLLHDHLLLDETTIDDTTRPGDATPPPLLATPPAPARPGEIRAIGRLPRGTADHRRPAMDGRDRPRRQPGRAGPRRPARDAAGERASARSRGDLPRPGP
jgi:RecA/RadA recombinase